MGSANTWCSGMYTSLMCAETKQEEVNDGNILLGRRTKFSCFVIEETEMIGAIVNY